MTNQEKANEIISLLYDRHGFDDWWTSCGEENRKEIREQILSILNDDYARQT